MGQMVRTAPLTAGQLGYQSARCAYLYPRRRPACSRRPTTRVRRTFKNSFSEMLGYRIGCNIFDIVFDLSYRRHGALLVYDPKGEALKEVNNPESIVHPSGTADKLRSLLSGALRNVSLSTPSFRDRKKRWLLEIASMDGAVPR